MDVALARAVTQHRLGSRLALVAAGLVLFGWLLYTPAGLLGKADAVGYAVCHRIDLRSFHLGERQMPLCARCTGMYLGAMLGLVYQAALGRRRAGVPSWRVASILGATVLAFALDGVNSFLQLIPGVPSLYPPHNVLRTFTGTGMGLVIAAALFPAFNQTVWKSWDRRPALKDLRQLGGLWALAILLDLVVLSGNPIVLYPLALVSAAGVVILLTMMYTLIWLMLLRAENRHTEWRELTPALVAGFSVAIVQIALIDLGRYWLTGSWNGFHLG